MSKRSVWIASIGYETFMVEPEDVGTIMYLSNRLRRVEGYPRRASATSELVCKSITFEEVEFDDENEVAQDVLVPTPPSLSGAF